MKIYSRHTLSNSIRNNALKRGSHLDIGKDLESSVEVPLLDLWRNSEWGIMIRDSSVSSGTSSACSVSVKFLRYFNP
ncbi:MAG: hypothetical protein ACTSR7_01335 [Promethearchaeota archaeon]